MIWPLIWIGLALLCFIAIRAVFYAPFDLRVSEIVVRIEGLAKELDGYKVALLADLHQHPWVPEAYLRRVVVETNARVPDLIVLLGDLGVSFRRRRGYNGWFYDRMFERLMPLLQQLSSRDGIVAVLGNHEHYSVAGLVTERLSTAGVRVLINECMLVTRACGGARIAFGGVDDVHEGRVDPAGGCAAVPKEIPRIVLSHSPDAVLAFDASARIDLVLAGHTHGGQIVLPGYGAPLTLAKVCRRRSPSGWIPSVGPRLYVSRGIGCQIPVRFCCPPELTIVRLRSESDQQDE